MMVIEINAVMQSIKVLRDLVQANRSLRNLDLLPIEWVKIDGEGEESGSE